MTAQKPSAAAKRIASVFHSIRFRLVLWFTAILALVLAALCGFIYILQGRDFTGELEFRLERKMAALEVTLTITPGGILVPPGVLQDTDVLLFTAPDGQVLASHGPVPSQDTLNLAARALQEFNRQSPSGSITSWSERTGSPR